jgi:hypothetical protein
MANKRKRPQKQKGLKGMGNDAWKRADLQQHNRNNTVPSGTVYKRKPKYGRYEA